MADPFALLGLEARFNVDTDELDRRHRELSRALHPDRYVGRPASERRAALGRAIAVNEAARALKNPITRGEALLTRLGVETLEGGGPEGSPTPELLMEIMELREELREAGKKGDVDKVESLRHQVEKSERAVREQLTDLFSRLLGGGGDGQGALAASAMLGELRYYRRFFDEADATLDEIA